MKAILKDDLIIKVTLNENLGVEIGRIPKGVGLSRLRYSEGKVVDLADLNQIWVEYINSTFILHAHKVRDSQLVNMQYKDRKKLVIENGVIRVKNDEDIQKERLQLRNAKRRQVYPELGDVIDAICKYLETKKDLTEELTEIINKRKQVKETFRST